MVTKVHARPPLKNVRQGAYCEFYLQNNTVRVYNHAHGLLVFSEFTPISYLVL